VHPFELTKIRMKCHQSGMEQRERGKTGRLDWGVPVHLFLGPKGVRDSQPIEGGGEPWTLKKEKKKA